MTFDEVILPTGIKSDPTFDEVILPVAKPGITPTAAELSTLEAPEGSPQREDINRSVAGNIFAPPGAFARDPTLSELINASMPSGVKEAMRDERRIPLAPPLPEQGAFEQGGVLPYVAGAAQAVEGLVPTSWEQAREMIKPPMGGVDIERENELGRAWRGELGPVEQAASITGTALQAAPLLHLPFAETPLRPTPADSSLVQKLMEARDRSLIPPPIPPEYAQRQFTMVPEPRPEIAPAPTIEETLAKTEQPPVEPAPTTADITRQILDERKQKLARAAVIRPLAENARQLIPGGEQGLEAELADIDAWLKDPVKNPVVHAPPETGRTGVAAETAQVGGVEVPVRQGQFAQPGYTAVETPPEAPMTETPQLPVIPPEDVKYAGGGPQTEVPGTVGISQARTEAELGPGSVEPGVGAEMGSGLAHGRDYINKGGDPRLPIRRANTSGMVGKNEVGIVHAELERLRVERSKAAAALEANPNDPVLQQNFSVADDAQRAWRKELQPVLTKASDALREAHAASMPDADVGTYQGLADLMDEHFKGERVVTPEMRTAMARAARGVKESRDIANGEMTKVEGALEKQVRVRGKKGMTPEELEASIRNRLETEFTDCVLGA